MGDYLARIRFPNGREIYAVDLSSHSMVTDGLYDRFAPAGELDHAGFIRDRNFIPVDSPRLPFYPELPVSDPEDLIVVRVTTESSMAEWTALFCPHRNELVGPRRPFVGDEVQRNFALLRQKGKLHLKSDNATQTLCGQEAEGEELPFQYFSGFGVVYPNPLPPMRDLFDEWSGGEICRSCLLRAVLTYQEWT